MGTFEDREKHYVKIIKEYQCVDHRVIPDDHGIIRIERYELDNEVSYYTVILTDNVVTQILHSTQSAKFKQSLSWQYQFNKGMRIR